MRWVYTKKHLAWLRKHYSTKPLRELVPAFNQRFGLGKSETSLRSALKNHGITCGSRKGRNKGKLKSWTKEQAAWVKQAYTSMTHNDMPQPFLNKYGVVKEAGQFRSLIHNQGYVSGRDSRFKKGSVPFNKGTKGLTGANAGSFKKGDVPKSVVAMWSERITEDGYIEIKIPERNPYTGYMGRFVLKHRRTWEKENGKIPEGMALIFLDGDKSNCDINNLKLVTRSELLFINRKFARHHPSLRPVIINIAKLSSKSREVST